jgi:hypothetical protein
VRIANEQSQEPKKSVGRLTIRVPASLHDDLVAAAEADGVSLNQFVSALLASGMRWRQGADTSGGKDGVEDGVEEGGDRVSMDDYRRIWRNVWG